jgi:protein-tyrosine sulfotransferase
MRPPIFLGGAPRSGLTLLRAMLDSHPAIACGPDLGLIAGLARQYGEVAETIGTNLAAYYDLPEAEVRRHYRALIERLLSPLPLRRGKARAAEKSGANALFFRQLHALFPDSPLIHVIRDGRDVAASMLGRVWKGADGRPLPATRDLRSGAGLWAAMVKAGHAAGEECGTQYLEIHYEDLVGAPEATLRRLCRFVGEEWDPMMLDYHCRPLTLVGTEADSPALAQPLSRRFVGRWRRDLAADEGAGLDAMLAPVLDAFGYRESRRRSA